MTIVMWVGIEKIIGDTVGHREEAEGVGDMIKMKEVLWQDQVLVTAVALKILMVTGIMDPDQVLIKNLIQITNTISGQGLGGGCIYRSSREVL